MSGNVFYRFVGLSLILLSLAGCNKTDTGGAIDTGGTATAPTPAVIQGPCPKVVLRDGTSVFRTFAKGAKDDASQIVYQASLADTTRQCIQNESQLVVTVAVQGRVVSGPAGGPGSITLPIRVAVTDGNNTLYSELTQYPVQVAAGAGATQFIFTKTGVGIPAGAGDFTQIFVGFDEGPAPKKKK